MATTPKFTFPYASLTPIDGKPTNTTLQVLQRQLFTNARSVPSLRGGGNHGHLTIVLPAAEYLDRVGVPFIVPVHPGNPPNALGTTNAVAVAIRNYNDTLAAVTLYNSLSAALTSQILSAVNPSFLSVLEDPDFGFGDVTPLTMLTHLRAEYGTMTPEELERNRSALSEPWNFDDPIEDLWAKLANIQGVATLGNVPIPEITIVTLTLAMIEKTGLLVTTTEKFRLRPVDEWTIALFKSEFQLGNKERVRRLTAGSAGFHGAHHAPTVPTPDAPATTPRSASAAAAVTPATAVPVSAASRHVTVEGGKMYYCWTHGLGPFRNHTSATCHRKAEGHKDDATAFKMKGGNNTIQSGRPRQLSASLAPAAASDTN